MGPDKYRRPRAPPARRQPGGARSAVAWGDHNPGCADVSAARDARGGRRGRVPAGPPPRRSACRGADPGGGRRDGLSLGDAGLRGLPRRLAAVATGGRSRRTGPPRHAADPRRPHRVGGRPAAAGCGQDVAGPDGVVRRRAHARRRASGAAGPAGAEATVGGRGGGGGLRWPHRQRPPGGRHPGDRPAPRRRHGGGGGGGRTRPEGRRALRCLARAGRGAALRAGRGVHLAHGGERPARGPPVRSPACRTPARTARRQECRRPGPATGPRRE